MSVDKFGHFSNYKKEALRKDVPKWFGFTLDKDKNIDFQNKRIKNIRTPLEETDAVNKSFLFAQISNEHKILKNEINLEITPLREELSTFKLQTKNIISSEQKILKNGINLEIIRLREELSTLRSQIKNILEVLKKPH